ncbi:RNA polymerase sigma factor [Sphingobacterium suaedae]|uniref:RNA polymerase sigma factor n=1 Tax=Sphingobacterium suaedae TaxID=1686402 RepID=A0ABW5KEL7_9SPHI
MQELIDRLRDGDETAFQMFFYQHKDALYNYAQLHLRDEAVAADVVQEVFIKFWNHVEHVDPQQNVRAYLYTIARHTVFEELRKRLQFQHYADYALHHIAACVNNNEETVYVHDLEKLYQEAIARLPEQRQKIFRLSKLEHLSHDEIADLLQISKNTVRDQLVKGNKFVKDYILKRSSFLTLALLFIEIL